MNTYVSSKKGLKIVINPKKVYLDAQGNPKKEEGKYIEFVNGKFVTDDKEIIDFIDNYIKKHPGLISKIDIPDKK